MKQLFTRSKKLLFVIAALFVGASSAWADAITLPYSYGFENYNLATDGWTTQNPSELNSGEFQIAGAAKKTGSYGFRFSSYSSKGDNTQYLISPELNAPNGVILSFSYAASSTSGKELFKVGYSTTDATVESFTFGDEISYNKTSWTEYTNTFPAGTKYIAVYYYANYQYRLYVDDFTFTAPEVFNGPALKVFEGETELTSGYSYNYGLTTAGKEQPFTLKNPGSESITLNIAATGGFGVTPANVTIAAGGETTLTVSMADATATGAVTITPTASGVDAFTINVSGTVREAGKIFIDFSDNPLPSTWIKDSEWSVSDGVATINYKYENYEYVGSYIRSGAISVDANGENLIFKYARNSSSTYSSYVSDLKVYWATTGNGSNADWTEAVGTTPEFEYNVWKNASYAIPANAKYVAIYGKYVKVDDIYGLTEVAVPIMKVTQPASLDFGVIASDDTKTFTIANDGKAALENINVSCDNAAFTISNAPTSLAANGSQEVTITMSAANIGSFTGKITVSAPEQTTVEFTVKGTVLPNGLTVIDFNNNQIPNDRWALENSVSFSNGAAVFGSTFNGTPILTTPKVEMGEYLVVKAKKDYSGTSYYLTVKGSTDNGGSYSYTKTLDVTYGNGYEYFVLSDIPATVNKLQFVGYYASIDEIQGINYAPELTVTLNDVTVATPASYDFEETTGDATVTYNFANIGEGTLNITNVAITGTGAAAYSTNWETSVAVPFGLEITRKYDATRAGAAQNATVTVTTTDGTFVINVTGTDRAANAPELALDVDALDFGKLAANDTKTVTVTNAGTGTMTVNIASDNALFTVSAAQLTEIAASESKTFDVTFNYDQATTFGALTANITVTPTYDETAAKTIAASVNARDPQTWIETFDDANVADRGWTMDSGWSITGGQAVAGGNMSKYLTTPYLTVNGTADELTFDYEVTGTYTTYIYYYTKKDNGEWSSYKYISGAAGSKGSFTLTGLEAGTYQFRFSGSSFKLDNFEGFTRFIPAHDAEITAQTIPTTGYQNRPYTATVTVKEKAGKAETGVMATLYIGNEAVATDTQDLAANDETTFTLSFTPKTTMSGTAKIVVTYEDVTLNSTTATVNISATTTYDETKENVIAAGYKNIILNRTFIKGWNTICLPFAIEYPNSIESVFGSGVKAYEFTSYSAADGLGFTVATKQSDVWMKHNTPYLLFIPEDINVDALSEIFLTSVYVREATPEVFKEPVTFKGTYSPMAAGSLTGSYVLTTTAKIAKANASASMKAFRAYFTTATDGARMTINFDDSTSGIGAITTDGDIEVGTLYNLKGQKVQGTQKGPYIINGKKVLIK